MCLSTVNFSLTWDKRNKFYLGYGYKSVCQATLNKLRTWQEATGWHTDCLNKAQTQSEDRVDYIPGFHIFLNEPDARKYWSGGIIIRVKFREVLSFGTNETLCTEYGPCVIARYMKLDKIID